MRLGQSMRRFPRVLLAVLFMLALLPALPGSVVRAATCTVTSAADSGGGTLRDAINSVNAGACNLINFSIGSGAQRIALSSALPGVFSPVGIDGTTQPGYANVPLIELNIGSAPGGTRGLIIAGGGSTVKGLAITGFGGAGGIGLYLLNTGGNTVLGNDIGTNASGAGGLGNDIGIYVDQIANNTIGGTTAATRNVVSGNAGNGIVVAKGSNNTIQGNYVGINPAGTTALGNFTGVYITAGTIGGGGVANTNTVGGTAAGAGNVISGNNNAGIAIDGSGGTATGNTVLGNLIGTNATGNAAVGNHFGVFISAASNNTVGGTVPGARNVLSANINVPSPDPVANGDGVSIDGTNGPADGNRVIGNYIGTDATGTVAFPNIEGVYIKSASRNTIGGTTAAERNVISGNHLNGVTVDGSTGTAVSNIISGNFIGTNPSGTGAVPNGFGVYIAAADGNTVGGSVAGAGNIISGNTGNGVSVDARRSTDAGVASAQFNVVKGNYIGTNAAGSGAVPNDVGVYLISAISTTLAVNVISGNTSKGVTVDGTLSSTTANLIQGNFIGPDASGTSAIGSGTKGIEFYGASGNTVGGFNPGEGNLIAYVNGDGVIVNPATGAANSDTIAGNRIFGMPGNGITLVSNGNRNQAAPTLTAAAIGAPSTNLAISGTLHGTPFRQYRIEFFGNPTAVRQGKIFYDAVVTGQTDGSGDVAFSHTITNYQSFAAPYITATATDTATVDTSSFSAPIAVTGNLPPIVSSVSPNVGPSAGGVTVTITGRSFVTGATVKFGNVNATNVAVVSDTTITATTPAQAGGAVSITVTNPDGTSATLPSAYGYINPLGGPQPPGQPVTGASPLPPTRQQPGPPGTGPTPAPLPPHR